MYGLLRGSRWIFGNVGTSRSPVIRLFRCTLNRALRAPLTQREREKEVSLGQRGPLTLSESVLRVNQDPRLAKYLNFIEITQKFPTSHTFSKFSAINQKIDQNQSFGQKKSPKRPKSLVFVQNLICQWLGFNRTPASLLCTVTAYFFREDTLLFQIIGSSMTKLSLLLST